MYNALNEELMLHEVQARAEGMRALRAGQTRRTADSSGERRWWRKGSRRAR